MQRLRTEKELEGIFMPRGGISIYPFATYGRKDTPYEEIANERLFDGVDRREYR